MSRERLIGQKYLYALETKMSHQYFWSVSQKRKKVCIFSMCICISPPVETLSGIRTGVSGMGGGLASKKTASSSIRC